MTAGRGTIAGMRRRMSPTLVALELSLALNLAGCPKPQPTPQPTDSCKPPNHCADQEGPPPVGPPAPRP